MPDEIIEPICIRIAKQSFDRLEVSKKKTLLSLKEKANTIKWEDVVDNVPQTAVWYFDPVIFLALVKDYPWILDSNLSCQDDKYTISTDWRTP